MVHSKEYARCKERDTEGCLCIIVSWKCEARAPRTLYLVGLCKIPRYQVSRKVSKKVTRILCLLIADLVSSLAIFRATIIDI